MWPEIYPGGHKGDSAKQINHSLNHSHLCSALYGNGNQGLTTCQVLAFKSWPANYSLSSPTGNLQICAPPQRPAHLSLTAFSSQLKSSLRTASFVAVTEVGGNTQPQSHCKQRGAIQNAFVPILGCRLGSHVEVSESILPGTVLQQPKHSTVRFIFATSMAAKLTQRRI